MEVYSVAHMNQLLVDRLPELRALEFDVIVHIPRSGTIPASLLATYLRKPLSSVEEFCAGMINTRKSEFEGFKRILLVDDSVRTGTQMRQAYDHIMALQPDTRIITLTVYSTPKKAQRRHIEPDVQLFTHHQTDYIFPWFMWKTRRIEKCAVDMDGVLCRDCLPEENDDGVAYQQFLINADVKFKPSHPIGWIITARLEKYRDCTQSWLERNGIQYRQLIMGPWENNQVRRVGCPASWKAEVYRALPSSLYIESSRKEATIIHEKSKKRVWCIDSQEVLG